MTIRMLPFLLLAASLAATSFLNAKAKQPSFVLILVDDLGYMDIGAYNPNTFLSLIHI
mgnify:CR=1 FL=1